MVDDSYYQMTRPEIVPLMPKGVKRILEIGCAAGGFRRNFEDEIEYWGVEPVESAANKADAEGNMKVLHGVYDAVADQIPNEYFDAVVCNDVIEHIADTRAFLKSLRSKLTSMGCIVGSVPNIRFIGTVKMLVLRRDWQYEDSGIMDYTHLRFFTPKSFARIFQESGFEIDILEGIGSRRMELIKKALKPIFWVVGEDLCHMQYRFRAYRGKGSL